MYSVYIHTLFRTSVHSDIPVASNIRKEGGEAFSAFLWAPGSCVQWWHDVCGDLFTVGWRVVKGMEYVLYMAVRQAWVCWMSCGHRLYRSYSWGEPIPRWLQIVAIASHFCDRNMSSCGHALTCRCIASSISALHLTLLQDGVSYIICQYLCTVHGSAQSSVYRFC